MVARHKDTGQAYYFRHDAFKPEFHRIDGRWYLAITPHYVFTTDGRTPHPRSEDLLSGLKRLEHQQAVLGQIVMWKHKLTYLSPRGLFDGNDERKPFFSFGDLLQSQCERCVDDHQWLQTEMAATEADDIDEQDDWGLF